jgi:hypothetical protein
MSHTPWFGMACCFVCHTSTYINKIITDFSKVPQILSFFNQQTNDKEFLKIKVYTQQQISAHKQNNILFYTSNFIPKSVILAQHKTHHPHAIKGHCISEVKSIMYLNIVLKYEKKNI